MIPAVRQDRHPSISIHGLNAENLFRPEQAIAITRGTAKDIDHDMKKGAASEDAAPSVVPR
jgi:hypothetical protein